MTHEPTGPSHQFSHRRYSLEEVITSRDSSRKIIEYEGGLINSRISWLVASQSFLLGTYALLLNSPSLHINELEKRVQLQGPDVTFDAFRMMNQVEQLRFWFAFIGTAMAVVTSIAVFAGYRAILKRNREFIHGIYSEVGEELRRLVPPPLAGRDRRVWGMGTTVIGPMFVFVWGGLQVFRLSEGMTSTYAVAAAAVATLSVIWLVSAYRLTPIEEMPSLQWFFLLRNKVVWDWWGRRTILIAGNGKLGSRIKLRLERFGYRVIFIDTRQPQCFLQDDRGRPMRDFERRIQRAALLLILVEGDNEVRAVLDGAYKAGLPDTCLVVNHSTLSISGAKQTSANCAEHGYRYIEMPLSGGTSGAETGALVGCYAGDKEVYLTALRYLKCYCSGDRSIRFSEFGEPAAYKLVNQIGIAGALLGAVESMAAAQLLGLRPHDALMVLSRGAADSWSMRHHALEIAESRFNQSGRSACGISVTNFLKDLQYASSVIPNASKLRGTMTVMELLRQVEQSGRGQHSSHVIYVGLLDQLRGAAANP